MLSVTYLRTRAARALRLLLLCSVAAGCGWDDAPSTAMDSGADTDLPLMPWQTGNRWTYRVTSGAGVSEKVVTVGAPEAVGGDGPHANVLAHRASTTSDGIEVTVSWRNAENDRVIRFREIAVNTFGTILEDKHWDPSKTYVDSAVDRREVGARWTETYQETRRQGGFVATDTVSDEWVVDGVNVPVTVPAGTYSAIVLQKADSHTVKTYWFVPGIGKVKETGGQLEELSDVMLAEAP